MEGPTSEVFRRNGIAAQSSEGANCFSLVLASAAEAGGGGGGKRTLDLQVIMPPPLLMPLPSCASLSTHSGVSKRAQRSSSLPGLPSVPQLLQPAQRAPPA